MRYGKRITELMNRKVPTRIGLVIGSVLYFSYGLTTVVFLNAIMQPEFILTWLFPDIFLQIMMRLVPSILMFLVPAYLLWKIFRGIESSWFFLGASSMSLVYAGWSLMEIAGLYYINVGRFPFSVEGYSFPAIYTFKLFRSIFLATFFGVVGYWAGILKRKG